MEIDAKEDTQTPDLFQPEILSKITLIDILKERCPHIGKLADLDQNELVELFYKNVAPMPQRKYRANRRGQKMTKHQILREKRKRKHDDSSGSIHNSSPSQHLRQTSGLITSFGITPAVDRLKPPPSAINQDKRILKLGKSLGHSGPAATHSTSTKIRVTNSRAKYMDTDTVKKNQGADSKLSHIVINSTHRNGSSHSKNSGLKLDTTRTLPEVSSTPVCKVKLKRTSAASIENVMDIGDLQDEQVEQKVAHTDISSVTMVTENSMNNQTESETKVISPSSAGSRQISFINRTMNRVTDGTPKRSCDNEASGISDNKKKVMSPTVPATDTDNSDDVCSPTTMIQKKFKRVAVTWP